MSVHFPWVKQLVTVPSSNFHFRGSSSCCGGALESVEWVFRSPCRFTSCLFIRSMCCNPASNMLMFSVKIAFLFLFRLLFGLRSFSIFLLKKVRWRNAGGSRRETIFKWSEKDVFVSFLTIFSCSGDHYLPFKPIWILQSAPKGCSLCRQKRRHHFAPSKKSHKSNWKEIPKMPFYCSPWWFLCMHGCCARENSFH